MWTMGRGGERGSGISVLMVQHDDDIFVLTAFQSSIYRHGF